MELMGSAAESGVCLSLLLPSQLVSDAVLIPVV